MKLDPIHSDPVKRKEILDDLRRLTTLLATQQLRVCPGCENECAKCGSTTCTCLCGPECPHAPRAMSSDPDEHPIEARIAPLVYGLNRLRVCPPYWSCEGHLFPSGDLMRVPQVWFFTRSLIYPKLIDEHVFWLHQQKKLKNPWHVSLAYAENRLETGFSIEPDAKLIDKPDLEILQNDARVIAMTLVDGLDRLARNYLRKHDHTPAHHAVWSGPIPAV